MIESYAHSKEQSEVLEEIGVQKGEGLNTKKISEHKEKYGKNEITQKKEKSAFARFLLQFHNALVYILLVATALSTILGEYIDAAVIFGVVLINSIIGYIQESKAHAAINSLKNLLSASALVLRDGKKIKIPSNEIVVGDIIYLASGDKVAADLRLLESKDLAIDESALTGESLSSQKSTHILEKEVVLADRINMAYAGTLVTYGQGIGIVVAVGDRTESGKIAHMINEAIEIETPLTKKIGEFSKILLYIILALSAITLAIGLLHGKEFTEVFMASVALAVATIPEGLPAVVTITLAIGVSKMAKRAAIIRKLPAVETLGSTTIICSDKTGTLSQNQMTVEHIHTIDGDYELSGVGYEPHGSATKDGKEIDDISTNRALLEVLRAGILCNDSALVEKEGSYSIEGDPTEGALIVSAQKCGLDRETLESEFKRVDTIPFESDRQYMASLHKSSAGDSITYLKGSVERVLDLVKYGYKKDGNIVDIDKKKVEKRAHALASEGLRVLAFCMYKDNSVNLDRLKASSYSEFIFLGLQAMIDPPREEAKDAVIACQSAGIDVKMITGDHALTARAIAQKIEIGKNGRVLKGSELENMEQRELQRELKDVSIFARVAPEQKLKIVTALQAQGHIVAMTGDGVNDAPALKQADIGIAMGKNGTEVAKEAADMVLVDDNFATIRAAVEEGRGVYDNLIKFITWILPTNLGQGLVIMLAVVLGITLPVLPVQALWLNMTTAIFLGLMLAFEPKEAGIMQRYPREPNSSILNKEIIGRIFLISFMLLAGSFMLFYQALANGRSIEEARSLAVTLFVVVQSFYLLNCRVLKSSIFKINPLSNPLILVGIALMMISQMLFLYTPFMNTLFQSAPISGADWAIIVLYGLFALLVVESEKSLWIKIKKIKNEQE